MTQTNLEPRTVTASEWQALVRQAAISDGPFILESGRQLDGRRYGSLNGQMLTIVPDPINEQPAADANA